MSVGIGKENVEVMLLSTRIVTVGPQYSSIGKRLSKFCICLIFAMCYKIRML